MKFGDFFSDESRCHKQCLSGPLPDRCILHFAPGSQADFIYAPIYMSCYNLNAAAESNQKTWMALEGFMSRLLSQSGPILDTTRLWGGKDEGFKSSW